MKFPLALRSPSRPPTARALLTFALVGGAALAQQAQFVAIPGRSTVPGTNSAFCGLSGTAGWSGVRVSGDGSTVATVVYTPGFSAGAVDRQAAIWTAATGTVVISPTLQGLYPVVGIAADGRTVYGESWRWRATSGYEDLQPRLGNGLFQTRVLFGCSLDGLVVAAIEGIYPSPGDMVRWAIDSGSPQLLPREATFPDGYFYFNTISGDGQVLAGSTRRLATSPTASDTYAGVLVTPNGTTVITPEGGQAGVNDLSIDGSIAVGYLTSGPAVRAFRWENATGLVELDTAFPASDGSYARATNLDGSVIVGDYLVFGAPGTRAFLWTANGGFVDLRDELVNQFGLGSELASWTLLTATDVSLDGRTIVGQGVNPNGCEQAFLVRFPLVPATATTYGASCSGASGPLVLQPTNLPYAGTTFRATCSGAAAGSIPFAVYGVTPQSVPLNSLVPQALPGCQLLTGALGTALLAATGGITAANLVIPNSPTLVGAVLQQQVVQLETGAMNQLQAVASSNALALQIGSF